MRNTALTVAIAAASFALTFVVAPIAGAGESPQPKPAELVETAPAPKAVGKMHTNPECRSALLMISAALRGKSCQ